MEFTQALIQQIVCVDCQFPTGAIVFGVLKINPYTFKIILHTQNISSERACFPKKTSKNDDEQINYEKSRCLFASIS